MRFLKGLGSSMGPHVDDFTRGRIVGKAEQGLGPTAIAKEFKMAVSTVGDIIARGDGDQRGAKRGDVPSARKLFGMRVLPLAMEFLGLLFRHVQLMGRLCKSLARSYFLQF